MPKKAKPDRLAQAVDVLAQAAELKASIDESLRELVAATKLLTATDTMVYRRVVAQEVVIVNADGRRVMSLHADRDGHGRIVIADRTELPSIVLQSGDGGGMVAVLDAASEPVGLMRAINGTGEIRLVEAS